ncbi:MAG: hypothetical protein A2Y38_19080 [Spirochaetes bacterium GWB1_59_5]|nr:MAG: hypothetical protein A2Y38_19080 [Spirochaetes bacterium GWB1_59_5]
MSRTIDLIVIHCAATPNGDALFRRVGKPDMQSPVQVLDEMHRARGFMRGDHWRARQNQSLTSIGYHFVIYTGGAVATGRHIDEVGAHVRGYNAVSVGICMLGTDKFAVAQWDTLRDHLCGFARHLEQHGSTGSPRTGPPKRYKDPSPAETLTIFEKLGVRVVGHRDLSPDANGDGEIDSHDWLKICPGFDVRKWLNGGMQPLDGHVFDEVAK